MSTTGHCVKDSDRWEQGSKGDAANVPLGTTVVALQPANVDCKILDGSGSPVTRSDCRRGDQSYATGTSPVAASSIFRPAVQNSDNKDHGLSIQHFDKSTTSTFTIVGARPPHENEEVHKVGRTTGWTSGMIWDAVAAGEDEDSTCPGNALGIGDNSNGKTGNERYYFECRVRASYQSEGGDSGSPVFVWDGTGNEVLLVGVHWGGTGDDGIFIPIERIYAESLLKGYDWSPEKLRPLPALDHPTDRVESLKLSDDGRTIEATFDIREFSQGSEGMTYEAVLHRNNVAVTDAGGSVYKQDVSRGAGDGPSKVVRFGVSQIPLAQRNGELTVRVRLCASAVSSTAKTCGDYGSRGTKSLKLPPAPRNFRRTDASAGSVQLSWDAVAGSTAYEFDYRAQGAATWDSVSGSVDSSPATIRKLSCNTTYEFIVRAYGDGATHDAAWGFWSNVVAAATAACPTAPPPAPRNLTLTATHNSVTLSWEAPADSSVTSYQVLRRRPDHGEIELLVHVSDTDSVETTYTDTSLQPNTRYVYRVKAINAAGVGPYSNSQTARTQSSP